MLFYPRHYQNEVDEAALQFGIEPNLIYAIIKAESDFTETAVSSAGAIGLMQVLPDTFILDVREHIGLGDSGSSVLFHAKENILAGTYYFAHWYDYFCDVYEIQDPTVEALAAYNAGIGHVWEWLEDDTLHDWKGLYPDKIPFEETRDYVARILKYKEKYDELYGKGMLSTGYITEDLAYRWATIYGEWYDVDPRFVMAIIRAESTFNPNDLSKSGAAGLMQITRGTYADIKSDLLLEREYEDLFDPEFNIQCGTYYLHWIDERLDGYEQITAAYTSGLTAVKGWLGDSNYAANGELIVENIPIDTTRRYVGYVMTYYEEYCARYPEP
jgi:soluble lytic murein transglycosylase